MLPIKQQKKCQTHSTAYDLIGYDQQCELNCLICCDCLKTMNHQHKFEGINHKTISILELTTQFNKIKQFSALQIKKCIQKLNQYMKKFTDWILLEVQKQKMRLSKIIDNIILTQITKQQEQLKILQQMFQSQYDNLICTQIGKVSKKLFTFVPKQISQGFKRFHQYLQNKTNKMEQSGLQLIKDPHYQSIVLKDAIEGIKYPDFNEPQPVVSPVRVITQPPSPANKRTSRRSIRKKPQQKVQSPQRSLLDIKQFHVKIKKPLQFKDSDIIKTKDQTTFIQKLFPMKVYDAKMLYKASQNNFSVKRFHQFCDGQENTIIFVKTQFNKIIGGFTIIPWKSTNNTIHSDIRKASFLFSVTLKQKMQLMDQKSAIFNSMNFGPTFGSGADLAICHNANTEKTSYSQFPYSYGNSRYMQNNQHSTFLFTGQQQGNHFLIKEWEVWKLDFNE